MERENKWVADNVLKEAFDKLEIEDSFFPKFKERAIYKLKDFAYDSIPTIDETDYCIDIASEYIKEYANQINKGMSEVYAHAYAYAVNMDFQEVFRIIFAKAYEYAIAHGQDKTEAFCFGDFCSDAADQGYWLCLEDFIERFHENWQKEFYIDLIRQEYEQEHRSSLPESDLEILKSKLY